LAMYFSIVLCFRASETIFTGTRTQVRFLEFWTFSCHLLFEAKIFCFGAVLLARLVSELQQPRSKGLELRTLFPEFGPF
jgi:hypothetical protein